MMLDPSHSAMFLCSHYSIKFAQKPWKPSLGPPIQPAKPAPKIWVRALVCLTDHPYHNPGTQGWFWHCSDLVPQYNEHVHKCKVIVVVRNGWLAEGWLKISVCSPFILKISSVYL